MDQKAHRKELLANYKDTRAEAGVYRLLNTRTGKALLASTVNLTSLRNRVSFARSMNMPGALDGRLGKDIREYGINAFALEVLESIQPAPETTTAKVRSDLATLEALWREKLDPATLY